MKPLRSLLLLALLLPQQATAQGSIVADVSDRRIAVTAGFHGASTTLFGALPEQGDVIVTVTGPKIPVVVRRKERVMGIWLNRTEVSFSDVPGFYWVASSRPLNEMVSAAWLESNRIGLEHLRFTISNANNYSETTNFMNALTGLRISQGLYSDAPAPVLVMGGKLYRADVTLPGDAPTGEYMVTTYLLKNGQLLEAQQTPLSLRKVGSMENISDIAQNHSTLYAILAVAMALLTGWTSALLRRQH